MSKASRQKERAMSDRWIENVSTSPRHRTRQLLQPVPKRSQISLGHSPSPLQEAERTHGASTYYMVSGGPVRMTCHSKGLDSSTSPAENPLSVFLLSSVRARWQISVTRPGGVMYGWKRTVQRHHAAWLDQTHAHQFPSLTPAKPSTDI
jgi:hypothetical protein